MNQLEVEATAPVAPASLAETGLSHDAIGQLVLKALHGGEASGTALAHQLCLPYAILGAAVEAARAERLIEVRGAAGTGTAGYRYALTDLGRDRARRYLDACQYVGPAPVPLRQYVAAMKALAAARGSVDRERMAAGFTHLCVGPAVLDQLGPAVNSGKALFLYGPPGNGKTVLAEGIGRAMGGDMHLPHALDVEGQVITMYDPVNHEAIEDAPDDDSPLRVTATLTDRRWVRIKRPVVTVGGELTLEMLDLRFNQVSNFYEAPLQLKANGGVFVVDDFGRQRIPPRDLLNRWIVPLESRVDYLTLHTGKKFDVPFDVLIVFATNLKPESLADEAFLRRIPYKVYAKNPTVEEFARIFEMNCLREHIAFNPVVVEYLLRRYYEPRKMDLRACHPRDLVQQIVNLARYQGREPVLSREFIDAACASYFIASDSAKPRNEKTRSSATRRPRGSAPWLAEARA